MPTFSTFCSDGSADAAGDAEGAAEEGAAAEGEAGAEAEADADADAADDAGAVWAQAARPTVMTSASRIGINFFIFTILLSFELNFIHMRYYQDKSRLEIVGLGSVI